MNTRVLLSFCWVLELISNLISTICREKSSKLTQNVRRYFSCIRFGIYLPQEMAKENNESSLWDLFIPSVFRYAWNGHIVQQPTVNKIQNNAVLLIRFSIEVFDFCMHFKREIDDMMSFDPLSICWWMFAFLATILFLFTGIFLLEISASWQKCPFLLNSRLTHQIDPNSILANQSWGGIQPINIKNHSYHHTVSINSILIKRFKCAICSEFVSKKQTCHLHLEAHPQWILIIRKNIGNRESQSTRFFSYFLTRKKYNFKNLARA